MAFVIHQRQTPGAARQQVTFSCFAKEKVTKKKATPVCRAFGVPCVARLLRRLRNSRYALRQSSPTSPDQPALLGGAQGMKSENPKTKIVGWARCAHLTVLQHQRLNSPACAAFCVGPVDGLGDTIAALSRRDLHSQPVLLDLRVRTP